MMTLLTIDEVAEALRVSESTVRRMIRDGALGASKVGRQLRVRSDEIKRYLLEHQVGRDGSGEQSDAPGEQR